MNKKGGEEAMPGWLTIELLLLVFWVVAGLLYYRTKFWTAGFPLDPNTSLWVILGVFIPIAWFASSFLFGIIYFLFIFNNLQFFQPVIFLIILPAFGLFFSIVFLWLKEKARRTKAQRDLLLLNMTRQKCLDWINQFEFLSSDKYEVKLNLIQGKPKGRIHVKGVSKIEAEILNDHERELPEEIFLWIMPQKNDGYFQ